MREQDAAAAAAVRVYTSYGRNLSNGSCAASNCSGVTLVQPFEMAIVMPVHPQHFTEVGYFHRSLLTCEAELAWFPVLSDEIEVQLMARLGLLTQDRHTRSQILPLIARAPYNVGRVAAPFKRWFGMLHVFCCYGIPYAAAIDAESILVARLTTESLRRQMQGWEVARRVIATGWLGKRHNRPHEDLEAFTEFACTRLQLGAPERSRLAVLKRYLWWWSDLPVYQRDDYFDFFQRCKDVSRTELAPLAPTDPNPLGPYAAEAICPIYP
jgi:hypothetical protein